LLAEEVRKDLFPEARLVPVHEQAPFHSERTMAVLPLQLDPGPAAFAAVDAGWTPLRMGLILAWVAAVIALTAVALVGWSLIDLSERRIRFVSAVTHELRTPRSEERRVGKECRSRWSPDHLKKKTMKLHWRRWY